MKDLTTKDENAIDSFREFLLDKKEEFVKGYYQSGKVSIDCDLVPEVLHLQDYFGHVVMREFKDSLRDKFVYDDLERLKLDVNILSNLKTKMIISLSK